MRTHTIGAVLRQLKDEFDDVSISKIRFLESEGLVSPDRSDSGYRKFTEADVDRLRYVLRAQRDRYLPLRVIKDELDRIDAGLPVDERQPEPAAQSVAAQGADRSDGAAAAAATAEAPSMLDGGVTDARFSLNELADATGLTTTDLEELRDHGILGRGLGPGATDDVEPISFDGDDLGVGRLAAALMELGLEARHLRMFRQFADRELALFEQLIAPLLRQRNPDSRRAAADLAERLSVDGLRLHRLLLARELRALLRT